MGMQTRDQILATAAFQRVEAILNGKPPEYRKKYGSMAHTLPVLIRTAGLAQALAFVEARGDEAQRQLMDDLARTLTFTDGNALANQSRKAPLREYMILSQRAIAALLWFKRFAQSVLNVDAATEDDAEDATPARGGETQ